MSRNIARDNKRRKIVLTYEDIDFCGNPPICWKCVFGHHDKCCKGKCTCSKCFPKDKVK
jgi:hypothetical protein